MDIKFEEFIRLLLFRSFAVDIRLCLDEQDFGNGRFGTGWEEIVMGGILTIKELAHLALTQVHLEHDVFYKIITKVSVKQSLNNQLERVKIFKLDLRPRPSSIDHLMEFFDTGNGQSYFSMQQTCFSRDQRLCTYDEICPNGRFMNLLGCSRLQRHVASY